MPDALHDLTANQQVTALGDSVLPLRAKAALTALAVDELIDLD